MITFKNTIALAISAIAISFTNLKPKAFIPPGTAQITDSFFADETEISNFSWQEYEFSIKNSCLQSLYLAMTIRYFFIIFLFLLKSNIVHFYLVHLLLYHLSLAFYNQANLLFQKYILYNLHFPKNQVL